MSEQLAHYYVKISAHLGHISSVNAYLLDHIDLDDIEAAVEPVWDKLSIKVSKDSPPIYLGAGQAIKLAGITGGLLSLKADWLFPDWK